MTSRTWLTGTSDESTGRRTAAPRHRPRGPAGQRDGGSVVVTPVEIPTSSLDELVAWARSLDDVFLRRLGVASYWPTTERRRAALRGRDLLAEAGRRDELRAATAPLRERLERDEGPSGATWSRHCFGLYTSAMFALADAALAILAGGLLEPDEREALLAPLAHVVSAEGSGSTSALATLHRTERPAPATSLAAGV